MRANLCMCVNAFECMYVLEFMRVCMYEGECVRVCVCERECVRVCGYL